MSGNNDKRYELDIFIPFSVLTNIPFSNSYNTLAYICSLENLFFLWYQTQSKTYTISRFTTLVCKFNACQRCADENDSGLALTL